MKKMHKKPAETKAHPIVKAAAPGVPKYVHDASRASFTEIPQGAEGKTWKLSAGARRQWR
ncbi:hypothetical protein J4419_01720 [Candidatus Woesearchaeota archaeon]|nr:hypothetical protein [Candidatus Woesearchaeota archaeon]